MPFTAQMGSLPGVSYRLARSWTERGTVTWDLYQNHPSVARVGIAGGYLQLKRIDSELLSDQPAEQRVQCLTSREHKRISGPVEFEASGQGRNPYLTHWRIGTHDNFP